MARTKLHSHLVQATICSTLNICLSLRSEKGVVRCPVPWLLFVVLNLRVCQLAIKPFTPFIPLCNLHIAHMRKMPGSPPCLHSCRIHILEGGSLGMRLHYQYLLAKKVEPTTVLKTKDSIIYRFHSFIFRYALLTVLMLK